MSNSPISYNVFKNISWHQNTLSAIEVERMLKQYIYYSVKGNSSNSPAAIIAIIRVSNQHVESPEDAKKLFNFISKDNDILHAVDLECRMYMNDNEYNEFLNNEANSDKVIETSIDRTEGGIMENGKEVPMILSSRKLILADDDIIRKIVESNNCARGRSVEQIMEYIKQNFPYFIKGTGKTFADYQKEVIANN